MKRYHLFAFHTKFKKNLGVVLVFRRLCHCWMLLITSQSRFHSRVTICLFKILPPARNRATLKMLHLNSSMSLIIFSWWTEGEQKGRSAKIFWKFNELNNNNRWSKEFSVFNILLINTDKQYIWHNVRMRSGPIPPELIFWKWSNGIKVSEMGIFWCISITNNVKSCRKFNEKAQTVNFSVFTMRGRELPAEKAYFW